MEGLLQNPTCCGKSLLLFPELYKPLVYKVRKRWTIGEVDLSAYFTYGTH
jgi:hypothetical protein